MKPKILQLVRFTPMVEAALAAEYEVCPFWAETDPDDFLARHGQDVVAIVTNGLVGASGALIAALPSLRVIASRGVGVDGIDLAAAQARGVVVSNTPGVMNECVADAAFGALIAIVRNLAAADRFVREGAWLKGRFPLAPRVNGKRLGILGMGRIGRAVAARAAGFSMEVRYHNRRSVSDVCHGYEASARDLAAWADFLVVTVVGGPSTRHLVDADVLAALGENGFLVNVSRGSVVDETALIAALTQRRIAGAALDVFEHEPDVPPALRALDNVLLLPHLSSSTRETFTAMEDLVLDNLRRFFAEGSLVTPV